MKQNSLADYALDALLTVFALCGFIALVLWSGGLESPWVENVAGCGQTLTLFGALAVGALFK